MRSFHVPPHIGAASGYECGVDWYLDRADQLGELRRELGRYLARHAEAGSAEAVADAELVVSEAVGNAIRHSGAPVWVSLSWSTETPVLRVYDVGPGFDPGPASGPDEDPAPLDPTEDESGRGLRIIRLLSPEVVAAARAHSGMVVTARLAVRRAGAATIDPPRRRTGVLPRLAEARPEGGFGKESFLRALVVQLSRAVEEEHGPDAAEETVAQVGTDVGGQMEEEFRLAEGVVGRLTPEELGRCYVRLKHAIDGDFHVVEASPERIVLENTRCPFGTSVRSAPALCRMTSSVFGGIAARNADDGAAVVLEERIAVGDSGCRVVVYLGDPPSDVAPYAHRYLSPATVD